MQKLLNDTHDFVLNVTYSHNGSTQERMKRGEGITFIVLDNINARNFNFKHRQILYIIFSDLIKTNTFHIHSG